MSGLRNGARELARVTGKGGRQWVLAESGGYLPWVTWEVDDAGNCYSGHYHATRDEACIEFLDRVIL